METFGCFQKFSCKTSISHTLCYCETLFCTAIFRWFHHLRGKSTTRDTPIEVVVSTKGRAWVESGRVWVEPRDHPLTSTPHTILGASGHLRSYKTSSVLRMKAYSVMNAKVCTFLSCHCKICEEYFSAICTFSCSMNESFQNESTCWAESRKPDCGVANSMEEQQCLSCDWILFHFGSASPDFQD